MTKVKGLQQVLKNIDAYIAKYTETAADSIEKTQEKIFAESQRLCPTDRDILKSTGRTKGVKIRHGKIMGSIIYGGGPAREYAVEQHENLNYHHTPPEQAKYLEDPAKKHMKTMHLEIAEDIRKKNLL